MLVQAMREATEFDQRPEVGRTAYPTGHDVREHKDRREHAHSGASCSRSTRLSRRNAMRGDEAPAGS